MLEQKQRHLKENVTSKKISAHWHDARTSTLEGVFARGGPAAGPSACFGSEKGL